MVENKARWIAWSITGLSALLLAAGIALGGLAMVAAGGPVGLLSHQLTIPLSGVVFIGLGALVLSRRPRHPIAWILAGLGLVSGIEMLNIGVLTYSSLAAPGEVIPAPAWSHWLAQWIWSPRALVPITFLLLLFPDGNLPSDRWRPIAWAMALGIGVSTGVSAFSPNSWQGMGGVVWNPFGVPSPYWDPLRALSGALLTAGFLCCTASVFLRFRQSKGIARQQLKWMVYALGLALFLLGVEVALFLTVPDSRLASELGYSIQNLATTGIAIAVSIAALRHRLYDIDLLVNRTLVYGALSVGVISVYILLVSGVGAIFQREDGLVLPLIATALVAVLFEPLRRRLQRGVNRLLYGEREEPLAVLRRLGERLEGAGSPEDVLKAIVETVVQALKLPYGEVALRQEEEFVPAAWVGERGLEPVPFRIQYQGQTVGQLKVSPRAPGEALAAADRALLRQIARQAGPVARAAQLTRALRQSRARLVTTREEERRRLRRDLHDGLGPVLASQGLKIAAVRHLLGADPARCLELLDELAAQNEATVSQVRRLVYALRPPELDELGLAGAVREHAAGLNLTSANGTGGEINLHVQDGALNGLPAAVEVAAYRITSEALTNVTRHARAQHCSVRFGVVRESGGRSFLLEISDDGIGLPDQVKAGVGMNSMRERAEELRGELRVENALHGGTRVTARLPLVG
jgi:two-component system NarL family sensor kinase